MATDLARAYRVCARATRRHARNFYVAFLTLPSAQRRAVYALYAFCHEADEVADRPPAVLSGSDHEKEARRAQLTALRERLSHAAAGAPETLRDVALADAIARFGVQETDLQDVLTGIELDLTSPRIASADDLRHYCYHVASAVGLATLPILTAGTPPTAAMRDAAVDLGLGMQYVNILRDVDEDLRLGRIYLPIDELLAHEVDEDTLGSRTMTGGLRSVLAAHARRAEQRLAAGRRLLPDLPVRSRSCPWLLSEIYGRILGRIAERGYDVFGPRVSLPASEKIRLLAAARWRRW